MSLSHSDPSVKSRWPGSYSYYDVEASLLGKIFLFSRVLISSTTKFSKLLLEVWSVSKKQTFFAKGKIDPAAPEVKE